MNRMPKVIRIAPFSINSSCGGISSVISSYFSSNLSKEYDVRYIYTSSLGNVLAKIKSFLAGICILINNLIFMNVEIIHIHTASWKSFYRKMIFVFIGKLFRKKVILHIHGGGFNLFYHSSRTNKYLISKVLDNVDVIIVLTNRWVSDLQEKTKNKNIKVLFDPVDTSAFLLPSVKYRNIKITNNVLFLGRLCIEKGIFDLLRAITLIVKRVPSAQFTICGSGDIDECKRICLEKCISSHVEFRGWVTGQEKIDSFCSAAVFVLPTYYEALSVSIIEAMSAGLPIVSTCVGGVPDIVEDGINGFLIQPGDIESLAERIVKLLKNRSIREKISELNAIKAKDMFDVNIVVKKLNHIYRELLAMN